MAWTVLKPAAAMKRVLFTLILGLASLNAAAAVDPAARAAMEKQGRQVDLYATARTQLVNERTALAARARQLNAQVAEAKRHRGVMSDGELRGLLRDALDVSKQVEATDRKLALLDRMLREAVETYGSRVRAAQKGATADERKELASLLQRAEARLPAVAEAAVPAGLDITATAGMDADALLERADLAGDYEDKLRREALRADERIRELQAQVSLASEAATLAQDRQFFDEESRTVRGTRVVGRTTGGADRASATTDKNAAAAATTGGTATGGGAADPGRATTPEAGGGGNAADDTNTGAFNGSPNAEGTQGTGGTSPPPAAPTAGSTRTDSLGLGRSVTVVDERTITLLRDTSSTSADLSPADELRRLQARREALLRAATRLKGVREDLTTRARQADPTTAPRKQ